MSRTSNFKGHKHTEESKEKNRQAHLISWDKLSYAGKHKRMRNSISKPKICSDCGEEKKLNISNIDHKYSENTEDWIWKCRSCHQKYDIEHNNINYRGA